MVDFIDVYLPFVNYDYPIFNVADSGIFLGAFAYLFLSFSSSEKKNPRGRGVNDRLTYSFIGVLSFFRPARASKPIEVHGLE